MCGEEELPCDWIKIKQMIRDMIYVISIGGQSDGEILIDEELFYHFKDRKVWNVISPWFRMTSLINNQIWHFIGYYTYYSIDGTYVDACIPKSEFYF